MRQLRVQLDIRMRGIDPAVERGCRGHGVERGVRQECLVLRRAAETQVGGQARILAEGIATRSLDPVELVVGHRRVPTGKRITSLDDRQGVVIQVIPNERLAGAIE